MLEDQHTTRSRIHAILSIHVEAVKCCRTAEEVVGLIALVQVQVEFVEGTFRLVGRHVHAVAMHCPV